MGSLQSSINEYRLMLEKGAIQVAYRGIMDTMLSLRTAFRNDYPNHYVGELYQGYLDMTYFSFVPNLLKEKKLKIAIVFLHERVAFEAWLSGYNRQIQSVFGKVLKQYGFSRYPLVPNPQNADAIVTCSLVETPNFDDPAGLISLIESGTMRFLGDIEGFLAEHGQ